MNYTNSDFETLSSKEWIITNGIGGYASTTLSGANTRRYHGLLVASFNPPTDRRVLVSKIQETILAGETSLELSSNSYPGLIAPQGYQYLESFERLPFPKITYSSGDIRLSKTVFMVYGSNTTVVEYENEGKESIELDLNPLYVYRDYHSLFNSSEYYDFYYETQPGRIKIHAHHGSDPVFVSYSKGTFVRHPVWYYNFEYAKERYRGQDFQEDAKSIGQIKVDIEPSERVYITFATDESILSGNPEEWKQNEVNRQKIVYNGTQDSFIRDLRLSGDEFLVVRNSSQSKTIIAGYHWFTDWGRDTMIAMRGLTIASEKKYASEAIIRTFLQYLDGGMIPNRFPDQGETPEYNTIDATLWVFVVLYEYYEKFQDISFIKEVFPKLSEILISHRRGTRYNIHITEEGLLYGGEGLSQLTWMDARIGEYVVTPRQGCPVEINALWYNALSIYVALGKLIGEERETEARQAKQFESIFQEYFFNDQGYLNDVIIPGTLVDDTIRPNQIYAISLPFSPITREQALSVLEVVERELYTDLGLRSLTPKHSEFKNTYGGDQLHRDGAYHQGTVWAFLWGEYALAYLKLHLFSPIAQEEIIKKSTALRRHFYEEDCIHGISEIFDGESPKEGRGCIHQAWSIGMLLKVFDNIQQKQLEPSLS